METCGHRGKNWKKSSFFNSKFALGSFVVELFFHLSTLLSVRIVGICDGVPSTSVWFCNYDPRTCLYVYSSKVFHLIDENFEEQVKKT